MVVLQAERLGLRNFSLLVPTCSASGDPHSAELAEKSRAGFIAPGHVCTAGGDARLRKPVREFHVRLSSRV